MAHVFDTLKAVDRSSFTTELERKEAVLAARELLARIESPWETAVRVFCSMPVQLSTLKTVNDLGLLSKWIEKNDGQPLSLDELSALTSCDPQLLKRLLRHLASTHALTVTGRGQYSMTPFATSIVKDDLASLIDMTFSISIPLLLNLPKFLKEASYQNPSGAESNDSFVHWSGMNVWQYFGANPDVAHEVGRFMKASSSQRGNFSDIYPCEHLGCEPDEVMVVDIGGSMGHDLQTFKARHPEAPGRLVLQDKHDVIEQAKTILDADAAIEMTAYDFFTEQPNKGAQIYLLHTVLHDWPDADVIKILTTLQPALKKGYSRLLIQEIVIPEVNPDMDSTMRDLTMMYMNSGSERTEEQWRSLIEPTGFRITKIWRSPLFVESVIETEAV